MSSHPKFVINHVVMKIIPLLAVVLVSTLAPVRAVVIVQYTFNSSSLNPTQEADDTTGSTFAFGAGLGSPNISTSTGNPLPSIFVGADRTGEPVSPTSTDYVVFSLTANTDFVLNLSSLSFDYAFTGGDSSQSATFAVCSSIDGFSSNLGSYTALRQTSATFTTTSPPVDLSSAAFSNLSNVEFRLYLTDTTSSNTSYLRMDNITLNGTVAAVPEPRVGAMLLIGLLAFVVRRSLSFQ